MFLREKGDQLCEISDGLAKGCSHRWVVGGVELGLKVTEQLKLRTDLGCPIGAGTPAVGV